MAYSILSEFQSFIDSLLETEPVFKDTSVSFSKYKNSENTNVLEVNLENKSKLGLILIYEDSYVHIEVHDKLTADPIFINSLSFKDFLALENILKLYLVNQWN